MFSYMKLRTLPGTIIELSPSDYAPEKLLSNLFLTGGLVLSQISSMTGLAPYVLQNWVKRGFVSHPEHKKYTCNQFCRIIMINFLKDALQFEQITRLLNSVTESANALLDETALYCYFVDAVNAAALGPDKVKSGVDSVLQDFREPYPGARKKLAAVLEIMAINYISSHIRQSAEILLKSIIE